MQTGSDQSLHWDMHMKAILRSPFLLLLLTSLQAACVDSDEPALTAAELVFRNAAIYTVDANRSWATAVAISNGQIVYVGYDEGLAPWLGPETKVIDAGGRMLMPSFQDSHVHPIIAGMQAATVDLSKHNSLPGYIEAVKSYAESHPDDAWIVGGGWRMDHFGPGGKASKRLLDEVVPDRPVYLVSSDGHSGWANSKALELAGIDEDTQDPDGGIVDRSADGEIVGSLQEYAMELVAVHVPLPSTAQYQAALRYSNNLLNSYGITAIQDAWVTDDDLETYRLADEAGELSLRVVASLFWDREAGVEQIEKFRNQRDEYTKGHVYATTVKIMQDGVPENFTAAMSEPYFVDGDPMGIPMVEPEQLKIAVTALDESGFQVHFHAIGDAAISQSLDAVEAALLANGDLHHRHNISHLELINPRDIQRFRELGVIANFQPLWARNSRYITELTIPFVGEERAEWLYNVRSVVNSGAMIAFGSDWPVTTVNPFPIMETAVTRIDAIEDMPPLLPEQSIDLQTAIAAYTINAAYLNKLEKTTGSIEVGKAADLIVIDQNIFAIPASRISDTKVLLTLLNGKAVYGDVEKLH